MDSRLRGLAEQLDAGLIARRAFLRTAALVTGGAAAGLTALQSMASAQPRTIVVYTSSDIWWTGSPLIA